MHKQVKIATQQLVIDEWVKGLAAIGERDFTLETVQDYILQHAVRPETLETGRLSEALADVAGRWSELHGIEVQVMTTGTARPMRPETEIALRLAEARVMSLPAPQVPDVQAMPRQEPGVRPRRGLTKT